MISSSALQDVAACITSYVEAKLEFTTEEIRCLVVPLLEERHPLVIAGGFTASINWLNVLMRERMKLPMRRVGTNAMPKVLSDDIENKHRLVLYRLAYLVHKYSIPHALVVSRDQSGINLFLRSGYRRAPKGLKNVDGHGCDDKRMITENDAIFRLIEPARRKFFSAYKGFHMSMTTQ